MSHNYWKRSATPSPSREADNHNKPEDGSGPTKKISEASDGGPLHLSDFDISLGGSHQKVPEQHGSGKGWVNKAIAQAHTKVSKLKNKRANKKYEAVANNPPKTIDSIASSVATEPTSSGGELHLSDLVADTGPSSDLISKWKTASVPDSVLSRDSALDKNAFDRLKEKQWSEAHPQPAFATKPNSSSEEDSLFNKEDNANNLATSSNLLESDGGPKAASQSTHSANNTRHPENYWGHHPAVETTTKKWSRPTTSPQFAEKTDSISQKSTESPNSGHDVQILSSKKSHPAAKGVGNKQMLPKEAGIESKKTKHSSSSRPNAKTTWQPPTKKPQFACKETSSSEISAASPTVKSAEKVHTKVSGKTKKAWKIPIESLPYAEKKNSSSESTAAENTSGLINNSVTKKLGKESGKWKQPSEPVQFAERKNSSSESSRSPNQDANEVQSDAVSRHQKWKKPTDPNQLAERKNSTSESSRSANADANEIQDGAVPQTRKWRKPAAPIQFAERKNSSSESSKSPNENTLEILNDGVQPTGKWKKPAAPIQFAERKNSSSESSRSQNQDASEIPKDTVSQTRKWKKPAAPIQFAERKSSDESSRSLHSASPKQNRNTGKSKPTWKKPSQELKFASNEDTSSQSIAKETNAHVDLKNNTDNAVQTPHGKLDGEQPFQSRNKPPTGKACHTPNRLPKKRSHPVSTLSSKDTFENVADLPRDPSCQNAIVQERMSSKSKLNDNSQARLQLEDVSSAELDVRGPSMTRAGAEQTGEHMSAARRQTDVPTKSRQAVLTSVPPLCPEKTTSAPINRPTPGGPQVIKAKGTKRENACKTPKQQSPPSEPPRTTPIAKPPTEETTNQTENKTEGGRQITAKKEPHDCMLEKCEPVVGWTNENARARRRARIEALRAKNAKRAFPVLVQKDRDSSK